MKETATLGGWYRHEATGTVMRCEAAGTPESDDYVRMVDPACFAKPRSGFTLSWRDTWTGFHENKEWTRIEKPEEGEDEEHLFGDNVRDLVKAFRLVFGKAKPKKFGCPTDAELLEREGWVLECESPLEIRRDGDGVFASGQAAKDVIEGLRTEWATEGEGR